jgi:hypothetical protein
MINKSGLSGLVKNLNPGGNNGKSSKKQKSYIVGRIKDIILDENHPLYKSQGELSSIGTIKFETVTPDNSGPEKFAKPFYPQNSCYPLVNELVVLLYLPIPTLGTNTYKYQYYYLNIVDLWNHPHHNASPNPSNLLLPPSQQLDYQQVDGGMTRKVTDGSTEIDLNSPINPSQNTFVEKPNIHPLMPFAGDIIYEGRFGNSLRFGNTAKSNSQYKNSWSTSGENGDPITILRNGQPKNSSSEGWIPITEDINTDLSSIWLTSYQKVKLPSTLLSEYNQPQIILNSDRIVINSKNDSVILNSKKNVLISSQKTIVESTDVTVTSNNIRLGAEDATESVLKGDTTNELLKVLTQAVQDLANVLQFDQTWPGGALVVNANPIVQGNVLPNLTNILNTINNGTLKSQTTKVK